MVDKHQLNCLDDLKHLDEAALGDIAAHVSDTEYEVNDMLLADQYTDYSLYLSEGSLEILSDNGIKTEVEHSSARARAPIFRSSDSGMTARCLTPCKIITIAKDLIDKHAMKNPKRFNEIIIAELDTLFEHNNSQSLVNEILTKFKSQTVELPSLPEIAININTAIEDENLSFNQLAAAIQTDPGITARIMQVANSPLYGGGKKANNIMDAISILGLSTIRTVVMADVLRDLFSPDNNLIKKAMKEFYEHSIRIAVICYDLAQRIPKMNPEHGFLVGLLHDVGIIPILVIADSHPGLARQAGHLETTLQHLKGHIGYVLLKQWNFDDEYANIAKHAYHWTRSADKADYCDLVQIALMHEQYVGGKKYQSPQLSELPAFKRLNMQDIDPAQNLKLLNDLSKRIRDMIGLLCS